LIFLLNTFAASPGGPTSCQANKVASLIGLAPFNDDSGKGERRRRIRGGRADVREVLYMAAMSARLHDATIRTFYNRLLAAGKIHHIAIQIPASSP
jgi:transposase